MSALSYDVVIIGGGPAGMAAALASRKQGAKTLILERDVRLGGILNQCIHQGFGLHYFGEEMTGPEYADRFRKMVEAEDIDVMLESMVLSLDENKEVCVLSPTQGYCKIKAGAIVLAMGCRERTAGAIALPGTRPAGIYTAGMAQKICNLDGYLVGKDVVILGSGDIGLIMARRLTLEGAKVEGVYEVKPTPSGLTRNIHQCLHDFDIPLYLSHTVTRVFGADRLEGVEVAKVDDKMNPIEGTQRRIDCDALILSVGLIPENELAESIGVKINPFTKGADCDQTYMSSIDGVFSAGNALNVFDLVDYVSECAKDAGANAVDYKPSGKSVRIEKGKGLLSFVPHRIDVSKPCDKVVFFFRAAKDMDKATLYVSVDGNEAFKKNFAFLRPPEMQRIELDFVSMGIKEGSKVEVRVEER